MTYYAETQRVTAKRLLVAEMEVLRRKPSWTGKEVTTYEEPAERKL